MSSLADRMLFLSLWLRQPRRIAAIAPSGRALARLMATAIAPDDCLTTS